MKDLPLLNDTVIEYNDEFQRSRLRALQSVDEMIENLVQMLSKKGLLDNTYIFYTTDNGFHISQHRMSNYDKYLSILPLTVPQDCTQERNAATKLTFIFRSLFADRESQRAGLSTWCLPTLTSRRPSLD